MNVQSNQDMAKLAINKSLLKEYGVNNVRTVYMKNGDEFQIQLYNPTSDEIAVRITIDNETLSNLLVLRPAERIWLERYLDKARKFKFTTYTVEDNVETEKAIENNGNVKLEFFNKQQNSYISLIADINFNDNWKIPDIQYTTTCLNNVKSNYDCYGSAINSVSNSSLGLDNTSNSLLSDVKYCGATIETGRVSEGSYSSQKFENTNSQFEYLPFKTEIIKILPESRKPYTSNDLEKIYCSECGRKLKTKYKFCPYCGTKIDY